MIDPQGYMIVKIRNRKPDGVYAEMVYPVMFCMLKDEDKFNDLVDALLERDKKDKPEDYIILPYW